MSHNFCHRLVNKRPFLYLFFPFAAGIIFSRYLIPQPFIWQYVLLAIIFSVFGVLFFRNRRITGLLTAVFALLLGIIVASIAIIHNNRLQEKFRLIIPSRTSLFQVILLDDPFPAGPVYNKNVESSNKKIVPAILEHVEQDKKVIEANLPVMLSLVVNADSNYRSGDRLTCSGIFRKTIPARNPSGFDKKKWLAQKGIFIEAVVDKPEDILFLERNCGSRVRRFLLSIRRNLRRSLLAGKITNRDRAFLIGMTIGEKSLLNDELEEVLLNTNTIHILVVSGLNVTILAGVVFLLLRLFPLRRNFRVIISVVFIFLYVALLDFPAPALRAAIMSAAFLSAPLFKRENDLLNSLSFSAIVSLLFRPLDLFTASFQLSMLIVFSLIMLAGPLFDYFVNKFNLLPDRGFLIYGGAKRAFIGIIRNIVAFLVSSFVAFIGSLPLVAWYFNLINPLSVILNSIIVPLTAIITPLGIFSAIIGLFFLPLASLLNHLNVFFIRIMTAIIEFFSKASFSIIHLRAPVLMHITAFYFLLLLVGFSMSFSKKVRMFLILVFSISVVLIPFATLIPAVKIPELTVFDIYSAESACLIFPDGYVVLINTGTLNDMRRVIHPFLKSHGINRLNSVILTSSDRKNAGGIDFLIQRYRIGNVYLNESQEQKNTALKALFSQKNINFFEIKNSKNLILEDAPFIQLFSIEGRPVVEKDSSTSLAVKLNIAGTAVYFLSNSYIPDLKNILQNTPFSENTIIVCDAKSALVIESAVEQNLTNPQLIIISRNDELRKEEKYFQKNHKPVFLSIENCGAVIIRFLENKFEARTMLP